VPRGAGAHRGVPGLAVAELPDRHLNGLILLGISAYWQQVFSCAVIILAVALTCGANSIAGDAPVVSA